MRPGPPWKRGSSWVDQNPQARVYRRRVAPPPAPPPYAAAGTGTTNAGPAHRDAQAPVDPPPPSNSAGRAGLAARAPPVDPPPPPSTDERSLSAPGSTSPPLRGAAEPSVRQRPPIPDKGSPPWTPPSGPSPPHGAPSPASTTQLPQLPQQRRYSTDAATAPRSRETWRQKQKAVENPRDVAPPRHSHSQSAPEVAAAATPQAHAAALPTGGGGGGGGSTLRRGTPSPTPSPEPAPPSSAPYSRGTTPSSGTGSGYRSENQSPTSSSSSGATCSGTRSTASSGSTSTSSKKSYADLFKSARSNDADSDLRDQFFHFLKKFTVGSAKAPYYIAQVAALQVQEIFKLEVKFDHLLAHNLDLAVGICNKKERASEFVRPVVCRFLFEAELSANRNEILQKSEVSFVAMPFSIKYISEFMVDNAEKLVTIEMLAGNMRECIATDTGMMIVQRSAAEVFRGHHMGLTWGGEFGLKDMVLLNDEEVRIVKPPMKGESSGKVKDVRQIGILFMPFFRKDGKMALYFSILQRDLENVSEADVSEQWFVEYILGHPGLRESVIRFNLLDGVNQSCKKFSISGSAIKKFLDKNPPWSDDWRDLIPTNTADAFSKIYWYGSQHGDGNRQPFESTNGGVLSFMRNFTRHGDLHLNVQDLSEVEKIGARKFQDALPHTLKLLLKDCQMYKKQPLLVHWRPYRDARLGRDGHYHRDGVMGAYPTFW